MGLPDYSDFDSLPVKGACLGSFDIMTRALGFQGRPSPQNPWFRSGYHFICRPLHWLTPAVVESTLLDQPIHDITTGEVYELVSDLRTDSMATGQRFFVTNHQRLSFWEEKWPDDGLMVWHGLDNPKSWTPDSRTKTIDIEAPHGLWDWEFFPANTIYPDSGFPVSPNPVYGLDSLDVECAWHNSDSVGSATCMYRAGYDTVFDAFSNPSSDEYDIDKSREPVSLQYIASHIAIRNIRGDTSDEYTIRADLIVNHVESDADAATGENNARRWVLSPDGQLKHLVYVSKDYIYYTTIDTTGIWLPAIPLGEGSYPSLALDTLGNPAVVWIQQGNCSGDYVKLLFRARGDSGWSDPCTLFCDNAKLLPPSFVIDSLNFGHVAYCLGFCEHNGNSAIYYGKFEVDAPEAIDPEELDASELHCGNVSIDFTPFDNSIHAAWEKEGKIWYSWKEGSSAWNSPEDVSSEVEDSSKTPCIELKDDTVHVVWAYRMESGKDIIRYRRKCGASWGDISSPSDTGLVTSGQPIVLRGPAGLYAVWSEVRSDGADNKPDICYARWVDSPEGWQRIGLCAGLYGTDDYPQALQWKDQTDTKLKLVWTNGDAEPYHVATSDVDLESFESRSTQSAGARAGMLKVFALSDPFPSPSAGDAVIRYQVPHQAGVSIGIYDVAGRLLKTLVDAQHRPGSYTAVWSGDDLSGTAVSSGVYFVRMEAADFNKTRKLVLLK